MLSALRVAGARLATQELVPPPVFAPPLLPPPAFVFPFPPLAAPPRPLEPSTPPSIEVRPPIEASMSSPVPQLERSLAVSDAREMPEAVVAFLQGVAVLVSRGSVPSVCTASLHPVPKSRADAASSGVARYVPSTRKIGVKSIPMLLPALRMSKPSWPLVGRVQRGLAFTRRTSALVPLMMLCLALAPRLAVAAGDSQERSVSDAVELLTLNPCLERPAFVGELEDWLERSSVDAGLSIKVGETNGTLWFSIKLGEGQALTRQFPDLPPDCAGQRRAIALSIALAIDALAPETEKAGALEPAWALSPQGFLTTPLPERPGLGASLVVRRKLLAWFRPSLGAFIAVAPNQSLRADLPVHFDTWLVAARLEGCFVLPAPRALSWLEVGTCVGPFVGALTTVARGVPDARSETRPWGALSAALELHIRLTRSVGVHLGADLFVSLQGSKIQVNGAEGQVAAAQELSRLAALVRLGPELFF
jgi:hypothetical protein